MKKTLITVSTAILLTCGMFDGLVNLNQTALAAQASQVKRSLADKIIATGLKYRGTPYVFGSRSWQTRTFDCSTFTQYIFGIYGIELPRTSRQQARVGKTVHSISDLRKGDLIFFKTGIRRDGKIDHVAVYMGNGRILHTIPDGGVQISKFDGFWRATSVLAKRVI